MSQELPTASRQERPKGAPVLRNQTVVLTLGVVLPIVAGTTVWWVPGLFGSGDMFDSEGALYGVVIVTILCTFAAGVLLQSTWALLIVPIGWAVGETLALIVVTALAVSPEWQYLWPTTITILQIALLPILVSTGLGAMLGQWLQRRNMRSQ